MTYTPETARQDDETPSPEFAHAAMEYGLYVDSGLTHIPTAKAAMARMLEYAPPSLKRSLHAKAQALGLIPPASGYLADGSPVITVEDAARHLGLSIDEVKKHAALVDAPVFVPQSDIHPIH